MTDHEDIVDLMRQHEVGRGDLAECLIRLEMRRIRRLLTLTLNALESGVFRTRCTKNTTYQIWQQI